jgi:hypothetical protein
MAAKKKACKRPSAISHCGLSVAGRYPRQAWLMLTSEPKPTFNGILVNDAEERGF